VGCVTARFEGLVQEVESYRSTKNVVSQPLQERLLRKNYSAIFFIARRLIDYMEFHVIGNDSVLKRLKVA